MAFWSSNFGHEDLRTHMGSNFGVRNEPIHYNLKQHKISWTRLHGLVLTLKMKMKNIWNLWIQTLNVKIGLWAQMRGLNGLVEILGLGTWLSATTSSNPRSLERGFMDKFWLWRWTWRTSETYESKLEMSKLDYELRWEVSMAWLGFWG